MRYGNQIQAALALSSMLAIQTATAASLDCGDPFVNPTGPWDYRTINKQDKWVVERRHYTEGIRALKEGSTGKLAGDVAYTLRVFPNHVNALMTMAEWSIKTQKNPPDGTIYTVECWFERGIRFRPDDAWVKTAYGVYLIKRGEYQKAVQQLETSAAQNDNNASTYYNLGLAYLGTKNNEKALQSAWRAYALGFPLPGLRTRLTKAGAWREPTAPTTAAALQLQ